MTTDTPTQTVDLGGIVRAREAEDARLKACGAAVIAAVLDAADVELPATVRDAKGRLERAARAVVTLTPAAAGRGEGR